VHGGGAACPLIQLGELLPRRVEADLEAFGFAGPAFAFGFADPGGQVVADAFQACALSWVNAEEGASDAPLTELTTMFQQFTAGFRSAALTCPRDRIG